MSKLEDAVATRIKQLGLPEPVRQFPFKGLSGKRRFKCDFAWPDHGVIMEVEGGTFVRGRHVTGGGFHNDCIKYNELAACGWTLIRADAVMVKDDSWVPYLELALQEAS